MDLDVIHRNVKALMDFKTQLEKGLVNFLNLSPGDFAAIKDRLDQLAAAQKSDETAFIDLRQALGSISDIIDAKLAPIASTFDDLKKASDQVVISVADIDARLSSIEAFRADVESVLKDLEVDTAAAAAAASAGNTTSTSAGETATSQAAPATPEAGRPPSVDPAPAAGTDAAPQPAA